MKIESQYNIFIQEYTFENIVYKMSAIELKPQWVKISSRIYVTDIFLWDNLLLLHNKVYISKYAGYGK